MTQHTDKALERARRDIDAAAEDLERVTRELRTRTLLVERLEVLADALLELMSVPALVVDTDGRVVGVSRGGATRLPSLRDAVGKPVRSAVPAPLADEIWAFVARGDARGSGGSWSAVDLPAGDPSSPDGSPTPVGDQGASGTRFLPLPGGSILVVFR